MRQHGKERIFFGQSTHTYLRISWNLRDEIFPKGVGVVTPQNFNLVFAKFFIWFGGGYLNFSKRLSFKNLLMTNLSWDLSQLWFWSWGFSACVDSTHILLGCFTISFIKKNFYEIGFVFPYSKILLCYSLAMTYIANFLPKPSSLLLDQVLYLFQQGSTYFKFPFYLFYPQTSFYNLFWTSLVYKGSARFLWEIVPNKLSWLHLSTLNLVHQRTAGP